MTRSKSYFVFYLTRHKLCLKLTAEFAFRSVEVIAVPIGLAAFGFLTSFLYETACGLCYFPFSRLTTREHYIVDLLNDLPRRNICMTLISKKQIAALEFPQMVTVFLGQQSISHLIAYIFCHLNIKTELLIDIVLSTFYPKILNAFNTNDMMVKVITLSYAMYFPTRGKRPQIWVLFNGYVLISLSTTGTLSEYCAVIRLLLLFIYIKFSKGFL